MQRSVVRIVIFMIALLYVCSAAVPASAANTAVVQGSVKDTDGVPLANATVSLAGPVRIEKVTDAAGRFSFPEVPTGLYALHVTKAGFVTYSDENVAAFIGETVTLNVVLAASSFSSLRTIGNVSTTTPGVAAINRSTASSSVISSSAFVNQGDQQVTKVLNETPGIFTFTTAGTNGSSPAATQIPQIRGALPYETESLIDGHPVSIGSLGFFSPTLINPAMLQNVEVVKGPGSMPTEINYAIGGTVNYRTLEPTREAHQTMSLGTDGWGGVTSALRATGSTLKHKLDYAVAYATDGWPGPLQNDYVAGSQLPLLYGAPPWTIDGRQVATVPLGVGAAPASTAPYAGPIGSVQYQQPLYLCCTTLSSGYHSTSELAKLRLNLSDVTALTLSYLGGQSAGGIGELQNNNIQPIGNTGESFSVFAPPPGYAGSVAPGTAIPYDIIAGLNGTDAQQQNLFQGEFRTTLGSATTLLARYYIGASADNENSGSAGTTTFSEKTWGGIPLCPAGSTFDFASFAGGSATPCDLPNGTTAAPTTAFFNGQNATFSTGPSVNTVSTNDYLNGNSVELIRTFGDDSVTLSYDRSYQESSQFENNTVAGIDGYLLPPSSSQTFTTFALRGDLLLTRKLTLGLADYLITYGSHYTGDGGATWQDASHSYNAPRVALAWHPNADTSWRFAAGASIAPPYISLLSAPSTPPQPSAAGAATYYTQNANNGQVSPETAFGYDLGIDRRIARSTSISADLYLTTLHDMFLPQTFQNGTYAAASGPQAGQQLPLYVTQTSNIGLARYQGLEIELQNAPLFGFGYRAQASFTRAYVYDLPAGFYDTAAGPYTTNLGIIPNVNFQANGIGYNALEDGRVPYSMGYGEINYTGRHGQYYNVGLTYYGPNNGLNQPAFTVLSATARLTSGPHTHIQLSGDNLTGSYAQPYFSYFGGVPVNLAHAPGTTTGILGATNGGNYGPTVVRLIVTYDL